MAGGMTEAERGMLMSSMSAASCALMLGRSETWVIRKRAALADLPHPSPVQAAKAVSAAPWRSEADPFAAPVSGPVETPKRAQGWRTACAEAKARIESAAADQPADPVVVPRPEHRAVERPARRWLSLPSPAAADHARPAVITPDPALLSEKHYERQFVAEKRAKGVSWFNISMMTGKTVPYLKGQYGGSGQ